MVDIWTKPARDQLRCTSRQNYKKSKTPIYLAAHLFLPVEIGHVLGDVELGDRRLVQLLLQALGKGEEDGTEETRDRLNWHNNIHEIRPLLKINNIKIDQTTKLCQI